MIGPVWLGEPFQSRVGVVLGTRFEANETDTRAAIDQRSGLALPDGTAADDDGQTVRQVQEDGEQGW